MSLNKKEQILIKKLESDVKFWKEKVGIIERGESKLRWTLNQEVIQLIDKGNIKIDYNFETFNIYLESDGIHIYSESRLKIQPIASNHIILI